MKQLPPCRALPLLLAMLIGSALAGCGQMGPLTLPGDTAPGSTPAPAADGADDSSNGNGNDGSNGSGNRSNGGGNPDNSDDGDER
jgi:predicted small lipoprotein YifL